MPDEIEPGEGGGWTNVGQIHTVPADELELHSFSPSCACIPKLGKEDLVLIYIHNSYDGREMNEKPNVFRLVSE